MKKIIVILFLILSQCIIAQEADNVTIFHRLLIFNSNNELMVVKIKNTDFWVTPGLYQNNRQFIKEGLDSIMATYGISISTPKLKGVFILKRELNQKTSTSIRNVFSAEMTDGKVKNPEGIDEIKWLSVDKAMRKITFPHINTMIDKITSYPEIVWGGSILQYKEEDEFKSRILEEFYPIYSQ